MVTITIAYPIPENVMPSEHDAHCTIAIPISGPMGLIASSPSISPDYLCGKLKQYFEENGTESVAVTLKERPIGFLSYKSIVRHFSTPYGFALFQYRPVREMMSTDFLTVEADEDLLAIAEKALQRPPACVYDDIVVVHDGKYTGLISIARLLLEQNMRISQQLKLLEENKQLLESMNHDLVRAMDSLRRAEAQLIQAEKMASIGTLAAGIAHDFNNVLNVILTSSQLLSMKLPQDSSLQKYCSSIEQATTRSSGLTRQLLQFSQKTSSAMHRTSLNTIVDQTMKMLGRSLDKTIIPVVQYDETIPPVTVDETQIQQVILNLAINARDAMEGKGTLTVTTSTVHVSEEMISVDGKTIESGLYVRLTIEDTGSGIPAELMKRIFDPFFTTKDIGKGSGLGLSVVYGIISKHHGHITIESRIGVGTKFSLFLKPAPVENVQESPAVARPAAASASCKGTILLVDDEPIVLNINTELLESLGYDIIEANNGFRAAEIFKERHREIGIVLLDMMMPGMDGHETFRALKHIRDDVKVLFVSGYGEEDKFASALEEGALGVCSKPIDGASLTEMINNALYAPTNKS